MVLLSAADSRYVVRALVFCDLDAVKVVRRDRRIPNAISFDGLKINKPAVAEIEHYGFLRGLEASRYSLAKITARLRRSLGGYRRHLGAFRTCGLTLR